MGAETKVHVGVRLSVELDRLRLLEDGFIVVRGVPAERHAASGGDGFYMDIRLGRADSPDVGEGHKNAKKFLRREHDALFWILAEELERLGMSRSTTISS